MANGILNGMTVSIDKAGRIVLPKKLRDQFRLRAGSELEIVPTEKGLELKPVGMEPALKRVGGLLVYQGVCREPLTNDLVERLRNERSSEF
jgi:AbrB family looped-hinge helix DNA binding protein